MRRTTPTAPPHRHRRVAGRGVERTGPVPRSGQVEPTELTEWPDDLSAPTGRHHQPRIPSPRVPVDPPAAASAPVPATARHAAPSSSRMWPRALAAAALTAVALTAWGVGSAVLTPRPAALPPPVPTAADARSRSSAEPLVVLPAPAAPPRTATRPPSSSPLPTLPALPAAGSVAGTVLDSALGSFASHFDNSGDSGLIDDAPRPRFVTLAGGTPALSFTIPGGGVRTEVLPRVPKATEGQDVWLRYQARFQNMPVDTDTWQLVLQWHQESDSGSPPVAIEVGDGQLRLANQGAHQQSLGPVGPNDAVDLMLHVHFSQDPSRGQVDVWRDGRLVLAGYHPPGGTLLDDSDYLKMGIYRGSEITQPGGVLVTRLRQGTTQASVSTR